MSKALKQFLYETYTPGQHYYLKKDKSAFLQIDDQDDYDNISDFINIFITVKRRNHFLIELSGKMPITQDLADLIEIYHGKIDLTSNQIEIYLHPKQIEVLLDIAALIKKTARMGDLVANPHWHQYSARTISSLKRFIRIIKEYISMKEKQLI